jgi:hypothetical protein
MTYLEKSLDTLADEINAAHRAFGDTLRTTVEHGIRAGGLLSQAREQCPHGSWLAWLEENFDGSARTAQEYIRLYKHRDEIRAKTRSTAHLTMSEALRELTATAHSSIPPRERDILDRARELHDAGHHISSLVPTMESNGKFPAFGQLPEQVRRGYVAETAWKAMLCAMQDYRHVVHTIEEVGITPELLDEASATKDRLRWWVEQCEWIESLIRVCDWPPGQGMPSAALDEGKKYLPFPELYDDESEGGMSSPRGRVRECCGSVV